MQLVLFILIRLLGFIISNLYANYYINITLLSNSSMLLILLYTTFNLRPFNSICLAFLVICVLLVFINLALFL